MIKVNGNEIKIDSICTTLTKAIPKVIPKECLNSYTGLLSLGWNFYGVNEKRGTCYPTFKIITIPQHAFNRYFTEPEYLAWYIAHEMAHAFDYINNGNVGHDDSFIKELIKLCPENAIHYELTYNTKNKKKLALVNGIMPEDF